MAASGTNQPFCEPCFAAFCLGREGRYYEPTRLAPDKVQCAVCGNDTTSGIWVKIDASAVGYPHTGDKRD